MIFCWANPLLTNFKGLRTVCHVISVTKEKANIVKYVCIPPSVIQYTCDMLILAHPYV